MPISVNGVDMTAVYFNGVLMDSVVFNGTVLANGPTAGSVVTLGEFEWINGGLYGAPVVYFSKTYTGPAGTITVNVKNNLGFAAPRATLVAGIIDVKKNGAVVSTTTCTAKCISVYDSVNVTVQEGDVLEVLYRMADDAVWGESAYLSPPAECNALPEPPPYVRFQTGNTSSGALI